MNLAETLLWPLTLPYGAVVRLRAWAYGRGILPERRLRAKIISVGNLTAGGTGKTPMVIWLAERLLGGGEKVGVLTRGYKGGLRQRNRAVEPQLIALESDADEPQLISHRVPGVLMGIGADRCALGRILVDRGAKWILLDDGFQHQQLSRDVDIVLVDATNPFGGGHLLPAGRLREPKSALARADMIVITRSSRVPAIEAAIRRDSRSPIFYARLHLDSLRLLANGYPGEEDSAARQRKFFAFCGIGNPGSFLADLREWGLSVAGHRFFPDHHRYTRKELDAMESAALAGGADAMICTEKDVFNLPGAARSRSCPLYFCLVSLRLDHEEEFWKAVRAKSESAVRPTRR